MTLVEYQTRKRNIEKEASRLLGKLASEYAMANSTVKVGDIVADHIGSIQVETINVTMGVSFGPKDPSCVYYGPMITTQGKPFKSGKKRELFQVNMRKGA